MCQFRQKGACRIGSSREKLNGVGFVPKSPVPVAASKVFIKWGFLVNICQITLGSSAIMNDAYIVDSVTNDP